MPNRRSHRLAPSLEQVESRLALSGGNSLANWRGFLGQRAAAVQERIAAREGRMADLRERMDASHTELTQRGVDPRVGIPHSSSRRARALDFGAFPPEINSGRLYTGPMRGGEAASRAWAELRDRLASKVAGTR